MSTYVYKPTADTLQGLSPNSHLAPGSCLYLLNARIIGTPVAVWVFSWVLGL